jgi:serine/threonine-protein kinase
VFVTDFGIAKLGGEAGLTGEGDVLGTPVYMSPEQARGDLAAIGPLSDVYSLGVILYRMLAGEVPFSGTVAEILAQVREALPPPPSSVCPGLDPRLDALCAKAMAKEPAQRFPSATAFAAALGELVGSLPGERAGAEARAGSSELPPTLTVPSGLRHDR